ncbi:MAG: threonylcarbamoyl-AMP synthase [Epulopiscium sp.]|nr:threonylcarbamoyl-AMP synthase [Candidatus Epulonipiscium sp.]
MDTKIISAKSDKDLLPAVKVLQQGGLVAMPTETVYGLAANALDASAVNKIFKAKGRPADNPLIIHIGDINQLYPLVKEVSPLAEKLIDKFWPGPLTLIFDASPIVPKVVSAGLSTVAIRFPNHPIAQKLINNSGLVLAAPSANTSGKPSPTTARRVLEDLDGKIEIIVDGGQVEVGLESTVVDVTGDAPLILRPGKITKEMLEDITGKVDLDPALKELDNINYTPRAPGMKYSHYAPNAHVYIVEGSVENVARTIENLTLKAQSNKQKVGIMATDQTINNYTKGDMIVSLGSDQDLESIAYSLFETLRQFDDNNIDIVYTESFSNQGIGNAIMNRLTKAASYNIINAGP